MKFFFKKNNNMPLKLVINQNDICKIQGRYYAGEYYEENKELKDILNLKRLIQKRYEEILYTEILLTRREDNLRKEEKYKKNEKTYQEFIESLIKIRKEREDKYKKIES